MKTRQPKRLSPPSTQFGFTIVESLVAIIIVGVLMVSIAPVIALSVATRVQSRRLELATQAARTYIDGVRSGKIAPPRARRVLAEVDTTNPNQTKFTPQRDIFAAIPAPPATFPANCISDPNNPNSIYPYCQNDISLTGLGSLYCVDFDADGGCTSNSSKDMVIQAFRSATAITDTGSSGYLLGVRVYRADAFNGNPLQSTKNRLDDGRNKVAAVAAGTGDRYAPLVEMTTEVRGTGTNYDALCQRLGGCTSAPPNPNP
jgi:prepilin-type N-terminal cleavage/methylation domain-containing protein